MSIEKKFSIKKDQSTQIEQYSEMIYTSKECRIALCLIPPDNQPVEHRFTKVGDIGKFLPYCRFLNANLWNIYITPSILKPLAQNRRKESFLQKQQVVYVDCDKKRCLDEIKSRYPYPTLVVRTSVGRYQVYWRLDEFITKKEMENLMRAIARDIDADIAATDVSRVLRLPGFWNRKPQRNNTADIVFTRDQAVSYKSLSLSLPFDDDFDSRQETPPSTQEEGRVLESSFDGKLQKEKKLSSSERDWYLIHRWLALGVSPDECRKRIISRRRGQKRNVAYYARYSVQKAVRIRAETQKAKNPVERNLKK